jgi:hypothetical protein
MVQLAIKGHTTRGREVIEILEMLGGKNQRNHSGGGDNMCFYIKNESDTDIIVCDFVDDFYIWGDDEYTLILTLEEFLEKFPYKVGDMVRVPEYESEVCIDDMRWVGFEIQYSVSADETESLYEWYSVEELNKCNEPQKEKIVEKKRMTQEVPKSTRLIDNLDIVEVRANEVEIVLDYCDSIDIKDNRISIIRTPKYPKTYEECCKVLGVDTGNYLTIRHIYYDDGEEVTTNYEQDILDIFNSLWKLRICRDAYWKIAGEEMGLCKPWEPDYKNPDVNLYVIINIYNKVEKAKYGYGFQQCILSFPTEEMRDMFYENFKYLIESCKEFL